MKAAYFTASNIPVERIDSKSGSLYAVSAPVARESFVRNDRIARLREMVFPRRPILCIDRARIVTEAYKETEGEPLEIRRALVLKKILSEMQIYILDGSLLVGNSASMPRGGKLFPEFGVKWIEKELDRMPDRQQDPFDVAESVKTELRDDIFPYWRGKTLEDWVNRTMTEDCRKLEGKLFAFGLMKNATGSGHIPLNNEKILKLGYGGIRKTAQEKLDALTYENPADVDKSIFYRSLIIAMEAAAVYVRRYAALARELSEREKNPARKKELRTIAENCEWIAENPAKTYWQALQMMTFNFLLPTISTNPPGTQHGRMDQFLYPYLKADMERGDIDRDFALDILESWYCLHNADAYLVLDTEIAEKDANYPMGGTPSCGGQDRSGKDATNDVSYMMLEAERNTRMPGPELCTRIHKDTPDEFLREVCKTIALGTGKPKLFMDETWYARAAKRGYPIEDVRDYQCAFCAENSLTGSVYWVPENAQILGGFGTYVELTLNDGKSRLFNEQFGPHTGDPRTFRTFDELMDAYKKQVAHIIKRILPARQVIQRAVGEVAPDPILGAFMDDCIEKGLGWEKGGARYSHFGFMTIGSVVAGNSLAAVKKLVFEDKSVTMDELLTALETNFAGPRGEEIRQLCLNAPKFGNDDDYVDSLVTETMLIDLEEYAKYTGPQGGDGVGTYDAVTAHIPHGAVVGATPDGRKAGSPLNEGGVSPYQGTDKQGPTSALKSVAKMPWTHPNMYGGVFNMRLDPKTVMAEDGIEKFMSLVRAYNRLGGQEIQFNNVSFETLREAQEKPEDYNSLIVRVAGYSSYFTGLARDIQDDILERTENAV